MKQSVLVIGGAGFIGSHLVDKLVTLGHKVRVLDILEEQVHGKEKPEYLNSKAEFMKGDMGDVTVLKQALAGVEVVFHQAAIVGVGQSMYQIARYMDQNTLSTATFFDYLVNNKHSVKKIIVASSMATYGEGLYECPACGKINPPLRTLTQLQKKHFELECVTCKKQLNPLPTPENKMQEIHSIYALSKKDQEDLALMIGRAQGISTVALRYFNVYGTRQSLSNPYTGVCAIFTSRLKNNKPPLIFEDGKQSRDFVHVHDVVQANILAMEKDEANFEVFNVASGEKRNVLQIAQTLSKVMGKRIEPTVNGEFRQGDVRHCFADISKIKAKLGYMPSVTFEEGINELIAWSEKQEAVDNVSKANAELEKAGMVIK